MNFMLSAGVRLCIRDVIVKLPAEHTVVMYDDNPKSRGMDFPVCPEESIHLRPEKKLGDQSSVFCQILGDCRQDQNVWIDTRTAVARIVEYGQFPGQPGFVRPGKARYEEWQQLIHECTVSRQTRMCAERLEQILREREPPCAQTQRYQWPIKLWMRPQYQVAEVQIKYRTLGYDTQDQWEFSSRHEHGRKRPRGTENRPESAGETYSDPGPKVEILDPENVADAEEDVQGHEPSADVQSQTSCSTPVYRLEAEYARVMRVSAEELDLEPAVYLREGSDLMAQLRDQLIMFPEIEKCAPECNIDEANVGVPGVTTPEMEAKMRRILKRHRSIFLGDGNAAPAPARGVGCDIDVGEAKPVALRARQITEPFLEKAELIEHSECEWSSPIVTVLKKNGIDIGMCIEYRLLNLLIKLSRYPLPLIDDLLVDFKSAVWFMNIDMVSGFWAVRMSGRAKLISAFVCPFGHFQWLRIPFGLRNVPLIYQSIINNCLWGFVRLPP
ncbi:reverse transcriptase [Phytophthora megakarya]|uniref:Reverse transcriptase n=1 Tax=Phytophthora megakarya TaxID=4795 RepID=A0A225WHU2_9STRA|nr:reverse transcriptase [Phytophthora megakarya]